MKKILLVFWLIIGVCILRAQNLDSLDTIWKNEGQSDSTRVNAYRDYIWSAYLFSKPDTAALLAEALHTFSKQRNYPKASATG